MIALDVPLHVDANLHAHVGHHHHRVVVEHQAVTPAQTPATGSMTVVEGDDTGAALLDVL